MQKRWPYQYSKHWKKRRKRQDPFKLVKEPHTKTKKGDKTMDKILDLIRESVIMQGLITLALIGTSCYLWATGQPLPETLVNLDGIAVGFFLGGKVVQLTRRV